MRVITHLSIAALAFAAAGSALAAEPVACAGAFASDSSEARLIETFGKANVVTGEVDGPEGSTMLATTSPC